MIVQCYSPTQAHAVLMQQVWPLLKAHTTAGRRMVLTLKPETRTTAQNARLWAMLTDISKQVDWYGKKLSPDSWKHVFSSSLKKQDVVPGIDGGYVVLGLSTSKMTKAEMSDMQELMAAFGVQHGVVFSGPEYIDSGTGEVMA